MTSTTLATLSGISKQLASIKSIKDAVDLRDRAAAVRAYAKESRQSLLIQNRAAYVKVLCERKAGEVLLAMPKAKGNRNVGKFGGRGRRPPNGSTPTLADLGITGDQSSRWQMLARWPERELARLLASCNEDQEELTMHRVVVNLQGYMDDHNLRPEKKKRRSRKVSAAVNGKSRTVAVGANNKPASPPVGVVKVDDEADENEETRVRIECLKKHLADAVDLCERIEQCAAWVKTLRNWQGTLDTLLGELS